MTRMVRKQIYITAEQDALLKRRAQEIGVTESEWIRRSIDEADSGNAPQRLDEQAWQSALKFMHERARIEFAKRQRGWAREDLYDERPKYLSG